MASVDYPSEVKDLIGKLRRLPGIGPRSAERVAVWLLLEPDPFAGDLAAALRALKERVVPCERCGFFTTREQGCPVCDDPRRESDVLCVLEQATDVLPIERSGAYHGQYHVLGGRLAPLDGIGPEQLRIGSLQDRVRAGHFTEVILALSADVEGEATSHFIADMLGPMENAPRFTRLAQGLPAGGGLDHADSLTVSRALSNRR
ncbi:recombination mediator RecR [soil metagenome]